MLRKSARCLRRGAFGGTEGLPRNSETLLLCCLVTCSMIKTGHTNMTHTRRINYKAEIWGCGGPEDGPGDSGIPQWGWFFYHLLSEFTACTQGTCLWQEKQTYLIVFVYVASLICDIQTNDGNSDVESYFLFLMFFILFLPLKGPLGIFAGELSRQIHDSPGKIWVSKGKHQQAGGYPQLVYSKTGRIWK